VSTVDEKILLQIPAQMVVAFSAAQVKSAGTFPLLADNFAVSLGAALGLSPSEARQSFDVHSFEPIAGGLQTKFSFTIQRDTLYPPSAEELYAAMIAQSLQFGSPLKSNDITNAVQVVRTCPSGAMRQECVTDESGSYWPFITAGAILMAIAFAIVFFVIVFQFMKQKHRYDLGEEKKRNLQRALEESARPAPTLLPALNTVSPAAVVRAWTPPDTALLSMARANPPPQRARPPRPEQKWGAGSRITNPHMQALQNAAVVAPASSGFKLPPLQSAPTPHAQHRKWAQEKKSLFTYDYDAALQGRPQPASQTAVPAPVVPSPPEVTTPAASQSYMKGTASSSAKKTTRQTSTFSKTTTTTTSSSSSSHLQNLNDVQFE
jgi:hypothetical protein